MNKFTQDFEKKYQEQLRSTTVSFIIPESWRKQAVNAIRFSSPIAMGIPGSELKALRALLKSKKAIDCYSFAIANNTLENRSQNDLELDENTYDELMDRVNQFAISWNEQTESIRNAVLEEVKKAQDNSKKN